MSDGLDFLLEPAAPPADTYRWATVTQLDPIRIRLDGDELPVESEPVTLCPLRLGCRVWVQIHGRMMIVLGVAMNGPVQLGAGVNLDTLVYTETYHQRNNTNATTALNYPVPYAGLLEVINADPPGLNTHSRYQRYTAYNSVGGVWARSYYKGPSVEVGAWTAWQKLTP